MSNQEIENQELEGQEQGGAGGEPEPRPSWAGPSQEEWSSFIEDQRQIKQQLEGLYEPIEEPEPAPDFGNLDLSDPRQLAQLVGYVVDSRMEGIAPYVQTAARDQGRQKMIATFDELKKIPEIGDFDYDLAERTALFYFEQTNDAEKAVIDAAKYAADVRKQERAAAVTDYQARNSNRNRFDDPDAAEAGLFREKPAGSYEEVLDRYAAMDDAT